MLSTTGGKLKVSPKKILNNYNIIKKISKLKNVVIGFGIRTKSDVSKVIKIADATIVGSGIVDIVEKNIKNHNLTKKIGSYLKNLKKGLKK